MSPSTAAPIAPPDLVFAEHGGLVAFEAEHFVKQELTEKRAWHLTTATQRAGLAPDTDGTHVLGASGGAYLELLPDTRWSHDEPLVLGENYSPDPGKLAVLTYRVNFETPGRYHVWARIYTTGGEDNGMHFGLDGQWPDSGRQWQTIQKHAWSWDSRQRTETVHVGVPGQLYLDVATAGERTIHVSLREDGIELDKLLLTTDPQYVPTETGPAPSVKSGQLPAVFAVPADYKETPALTALSPPPPPPVAAPAPGVITAASLKLEGTNLFLDQDIWAAVDPNQHNSASVSFDPAVASGQYHVTLHGVGEDDGNSSYEVLIAGRSIGTFTCPPSETTVEEGPAFTKTWTNVTVNEGERVEVRASTASNDGSGHSRARWSKIVFAPSPIAPPDLVFSEQDGLVAFEAEHFVEQELSEKRAWYLTTATQRTTLTPDTDGTHVIGASGGAYLELSADTRWTHGEPIVLGENLSEEPGMLSILSYRVHFATPGRYHVWARVFSTGSEDNSLHFGLDGQWPESGSAWQTVKKHAWIWDSRQRTVAVPAGEPGRLFLDVETAGEHTIQISLREDGAELDKLILTNDPQYVPAETGPAPRVKSGQLPAAFAIPADYKEFPAPTIIKPKARTAPRVPDALGTVSGPSLELEGTGFYDDHGRWAGIDPNEGQEASVKFPAPVPPGRYRVTFHAVGENDGNSSYEVLLGGRPVGTFTCPPSGETFEEGPAFTKTWYDIVVNEGELVEVRARIASNDGQEFSRARWSKIVFVPMD